MNNWLNRLERKYGRFGIPNLTNILVAGQVLVFAVELFVNSAIPLWLGLSRFLLLQGQVWRVLTFVFIPFSGGSILSVVLGIYFTWFIGTALEREWGDFRYTVYFLLGMAGTVLACLLTGVTASTYCLSLSLLLAVSGGADPAVLCDPHPGKILWSAGGGNVGAELCDCFPAGQAEPAAVHAQCLGVLCPHGLPQHPGMDSPGAVEAEEPEIKRPAHLHRVPKRKGALHHDA